MTNAMCPECLASPMSDEQARAVGCCSECARYLYRAWSVLDRAAEEDGTV